MRRYAIVAMFLALAGFVGMVYADEKADPTGTWKWTFEAGGKTREGKLKLKKDGDKLTGAIIGRNNQETTIDDAKLKDGEVSFTVTRERNGQKFTTKYSGKISGDTIKGKMEFERDGKAESRDWEAKREKE
jgi:hypothetical protein